jgi:hypothetical protein
MTVDIAFMPVTCLPGSLPRCSEHVLASGCLLPIHHVLCSLNYVGELNRGLISRMA